MASSKRFEDLKEDYYSVRDKITARLRQRISMFQFISRKCEKIS